MSGLPRWVVALTAVFALVLILAVVGPFASERPPEFPPTHDAALDVGDGFVADRQVTLDARDPDRWILFDFSSGSVVRDAAPDGWDIAIRRYLIVTNGGPAFAGSAGAIDLGDVPLDSMAVAPAEGYLGTEGDLAGQPRNAGLDRWYRYSFLAHTLTPLPRTYALRTADGRYARLRILGYYCPGATPGCLTFRYGYQGDGTRSFVEPG